MKLVDNGYYEAVGRNVQRKVKKFAISEWEPLLYQTMLLAYIAFCVGLTLAILTFMAERLHGQKKQIPQGRLPNHRHVAQRKSKASLNKVE